MLAGGLALIGLSLGGGSFAYPLMRKRGTDEPRAERGGRVERLKRPDGSELHVEIYGPADGPTIVLTHGWGANATEWYYLKKHLGDRFRLIVWDLPGLGLSKRPDNNDYSLEKMARDLDARGRPGRRYARGPARAQHRRDDQPDLLPALPRVARPQGVGAGPGAHDADQSGADDQERGAVHGLAEAGDRAPAPPDHRLSGRWSG